MIEVEFYAPGLRNPENLTRFGQALEAQPKIRYKVDTNHDIVYFEFDEAETTNLSALRSFFREAGLLPRIVGERPDELREGQSGGDTQKLGGDTQRLQ